MEKVEKLIVTPKWVEIKEMFEKNTNNSSKFGTNFKVGGDLDRLSFELVELLSELTLEYGYNCSVEDVPLDLWKERVWILIEKAGLLPDVAWRDDKNDNGKVKDDWFNIDSDWEENIEALDLKIFNN